MSQQISRLMVSAASNRHPPYSWLKYREAFSPALIEASLARLNIRRGNKILDPFAGTGTTGIEAGRVGIEADMIEISPAAIVISSAYISMTGREKSQIWDDVYHWARARPWESDGEMWPAFNLKIAAGAFPAENEKAIRRYLREANNAFSKNDRLGVALLILLSVLESVSYTEKGGQFLRWDRRARGTNSKFEKDNIIPFSDAIGNKIAQIASDMMSIEMMYSQTIKPKTYHGSALEIMPSLPTASYDAIITSPPYCNRYDYTRIYALELAALGLGDSEVAKLRQNMMTATVENRPKDLMKINPTWAEMLNTGHRSPTLINALNEIKRAQGAGRLNNGNIERMIVGYFAEMTCLLYESARLLTPGGGMVMVNDNVAYGGVSIEVDSIISEIATSVGFSKTEIETVGYKGNSSQQMAAYGRRPNRKSVIFLFS